MTCGRPDLGRTAAYEAEAAAFGGTDLDEWRPWSEVLAIADGVLAGPWWSVTGAGPVLVKPASTATVSSTARKVAAGAEVRLARPQWTPATVVHELAHVLAGIDDGHGPSFRAAAIDLATAVGGTGAADALLDADRDLGLVVAERSWPAPYLAEGPGFVIVSGRRR